jgi:cell wall-associated NlpC family hydrolase
MSEKYKNRNGAKDTAKLAGKMAGKAGQKLIKKYGKKIAAKLGAMALKKLAVALLAKTAPIWGAALLIIILIASMVAVFMPDVSAGKAAEYEIGATELGIPAKVLLAFDTALYENEDMEERNPLDSAYYFIRVLYERFEPATTKCVEKVTDYDATTCKKEETTAEKILEHSEYQGKTDIEKFLKAKGQPLDNLVESLDAIRKMKNTRLTINTISEELAMEQANFTEDQKEHFYEILEAGFIDEEFPNLGFSVGFGAFCSPDKEINQTSWDNAFSSAGVFKNSGDSFAKIAKAKGIDPVIMAAIAFHETAYGTSNAVVNKNNPGGLMNPNGSGLFVFSSVDEGLESLGKTLHNRILKDGKNTIEKLGSVYAPVGAANDPTGLNNHWVPNITKIVQNLGGLTMNCEANSFLPIGIDGATSESAEIIAGAGFKWVGNSIYKFGGGRSQAHIDRGWFDCSSFVHWAYKQAGIDLGPLGSTSTETLNKMGKKISISEIQVGDLIFWNTYKHDGHVAIYIGNGKFIGAQSSSGVAIVDVNNSYWSSVFTGHVRRLLP